ncbi:hypothetical protein PUN28_005358 [Cardiocondyla obscurior]|uniref:Uncharacterized protein n=1 Tax=Cardiocondyla obscurior TaxID=286306 RepID=A0AAW2GIQ4_9HYME
MVDSYQYIYYYHETRVSTEHRGPLAKRDTSPTSLMRVVESTRGEDRSNRGRTFQEELVDGRNRKMRRVHFQEKKKTTPRFPSPFTFSTIFFLSINHSRRLVKAWGPCASLC